MSELTRPIVPNKIIPIRDDRALPPIAQASAHTPSGLLQDSYARPLRDLRISVTDRCNFRCQYCMPKEIFDNQYTYLPHSALLSFEEIIRLTRIFVAHGVRKIRLTGGEPLLRRNIEFLIAELTAMRTPEGLSLDVSLTTNGSLLARKAAALYAAGLRRITVSLDALDGVIFRQMNDVDFPVETVLQGIQIAKEVGFKPIKINMVVKRSTNSQQILPMARYFQKSGIVLRFIEYMDVGSTNGWNMQEVVPSAEVISIINAELPLLPLAAQSKADTATRWGYRGSHPQQDRHNPVLGEIGVISSVTQAFCKDCTRLRLSTEGQVYLCLFAHKGHDLRSLLRNGASEAQISTAIAAIWQQRNDRYSELRSQNQTDNSPKQRIEMSYIGG